MSFYSYINKKQGGFKPPLSCLSSFLLSLSASAVIVAAVVVAAVSAAVVAAVVAASAADRAETVAAAQE